MGQGQGANLILPGVPGAGKTIVAATVVDNFHGRYHGDNSVGVAYIYLSSGLHREQTLDQLLASLIKQLLQGRRPLPEDLRKLYKLHKEKWTRPSVSELLGVLVGVVKLFSRTFIIVDALDEGQETDQCIATLARYIFQIQGQTGVSFMATSRSIPMIQKIFKEAECLEQRILASNDDICGFIEGHLGELRGFVRELPELQKEIKSAITTASKGMFLLAELYFTFLKDKTTPASIRGTLAQFQSRGRTSFDDDEKRELLSRAYDRVMERIDGQQKGLRRLARRVLTWIVAAKQPLGVEALQHALGVQIGTSALDRQNIESAEDIVSVCMGLVTIDAKDDVIRLVHTTVREYFDQQTACQIPDPSIKPSMASVCVSYLSFADFSAPEGELTDFGLKKLETHPFYKYAAVYWGHHAREDGAEETHELIQTFVNRNFNVSMAARVLISFMRLVDGDGEEVDTEPVPRRLTAAHLIAYFGLERAVSDFIKRGLPMDERDTGGMSPLAWAARGGHEAVIDLLLTGGHADPVAADNSGRTPLLWAMWFAKEAAVRRLLESGQTSLYSSIPAKPVLNLSEEVDISLFRDSYLFDRLVQGERDVVLDLTPLAWAAFIGDRSVMEAMLAAVGEDVDLLNAKDTKYGRTPLWWTVRNGHQEALELLLETNGVDPDAKDCRSQTPLNRAAAGGQAAMIQTLLNSGRRHIDLNSKDKYGLTPLYWAAWFGHEKVVRLLLTEPTIHLGRQEENDCSPLQAAA